MIESFCIFTVIKSKFVFFKMKQETLFLYLFKFSQPIFSIFPSVCSSNTKSQLKVFNAVDMVFAVGKFILRILYPIMSFSSIIC